MGIQDSLDTLYNSSSVSDEICSSKKVYNIESSNRQDSCDRLYRSVAEIVIDQLPDKIVELLGENRDSLKSLPERELLSKLDTFIKISGSLMTNTSEPSGLKKLSALTEKLRISIEG